MTDEEDLFIGLLLCKGHSQRSATFLLNGDRSAQGLPPVDRRSCGVVACARAVFGVLVRVMRLCSLFVLACAGRRRTACAGRRGRAGVQWNVEAGQERRTSLQGLGIGGVRWLVCSRSCVCGG